MASILPEVEEHAIQEKELSGPSNPMAQHAYEGFAKRQSRLGLVFGVTAVGIGLVLALISGFWLVRSVRRLNRQVAHLNRQTEQLNRRLQGTEQQAQALAQQASQAAADAQAAALQRDQAKASQATSETQAQSALQAAATAQQRADQAEQKAEESSKQRDDELQKVQQVLGQIAETQRTKVGLLMTLGEKSLRFDSGKSDIPPQYRGILTRIAGVLMRLKGYSIYVYGYTDDAGTQDSNLKLSGSRARTVRDSLVKAGMDASLISTKGFGKSKPRVRGSSPTARAANRRVEIAIVNSSLLSSDQPITRKQRTSR